MVYAVRSLGVVATACLTLGTWIGSITATETPSAPTITQLKTHPKPLVEARWLRPPGCEEPGSAATNCQTYSQNPADDTADEAEVVVEGRTPPATTFPLYPITGEEIQRQGAESLTEVLRSLPGFAINDTGFGADIHTGLYYRGTTLNQNLFLLNGRSLNTNISTYHGATDLNKILTSGIERIELLSGTAATLYGSQAFGGIVNVITKDPTGQPLRAHAQAQFGSYGQQNYRANVSGSASSVGYAVGYERFQADNDYPVPQGAANRGPDGRLVNGDVQFDNYLGRVTYQVDRRNLLSLDAFKTTSRKGLLYFGFPLQRDRLNHDGLNVGLSWRGLVGAGEDSIVTANLGYNRNYFNTYGPTQNIFYRQGSLDATGLTARVEHNWQITPRYNLRYGLDVTGDLFEGETLSNVPRLIRLNEVENRDRTDVALFALNTIKILDNVQFELGLRQNFNSAYGSAADPSVGFRWDLTPQLAIRSSWVAVRRIPGLDQLYLFDTVHNWLPNPDLKPEIGSAWTAGLDLRLNPQLTAQLTYFGNSLENRIAVVAGQWANLGLVRTNGLEAALRWQLTPQFSALANYTYTDARIETGPDRGLQLSTIPFSVAQMGFGYNWNGWEINLFANYNGGSRRALFTAVGDNPRDFSPAWLNLDLKARIPLLKNLAFLIYLENLADVSYEKVNRIYQPGLTFRLGLSASI